MSEWRKIDGIENYEFSFNGKSKESSLKKSLALRNNKKTSKPVAVFLKSGEYIDTYPSAMEAGKILNKSQGFISSCCRGEKASTEYIFKYV